MTILKIETIIIAKSDINSKKYFDEQSEKLSALGCLNNTDDDERNYYINAIYEYDVRF